MTTPYDPDGKGCGVDYPEYPYIYFASPHPDVFFYQHKVVIRNNMCKEMPSSQRPSASVHAQLSR